MYDPDKYKNKASRSNPSQARGKEKVRVILVAALQLFKERGFEEVTTNEIADHAQIPIGSLYRYFPNKESILVALTELYVDDVIKIFEGVGKHPMVKYLSWEEVLLLMVDGWVNYSRLSGPFEFMYAARSSPKLYTQNLPAWQKFVGAFVAVLKIRCPELTTRQALICFNLSSAAVELGVSDTHRKLGGDDMYYEAVGVIAVYMLRICNSSDHHSDTMMG